VASEQRAALITGLRRVELLEFPDPVPADRGVVVDVAFCGICGTDIHAYQSGDPYHPAICGHEWCGTVSAKGSEVKSLSEGDRVVVAVAPACGRCPACRAGQSDHCATSFMSALGRDPLAPPHGGFAPRIAVAAERVVRTDPRIDDLTAAQVEPSTVTFHAVRRSGLRLGDVAVVQGAGPIGLGTLQWVRAAGAGTIVVVEPNPARRALAAELGAHHVVDAGRDATSLVNNLTNGLGADVVYECVGRPKAVQTAVDLARRGGAMCLIGLADGEAAISPAAWLVKEIKVTAALAYTNEEFAMVMSMIADGRFRTAPMHTRTVGLDDLGDTLADLAGGNSTDVKVLVDPRL
jgi:(R,R)-butanediol dehydrogenase/meso-butanediol dehydrogenase/diacetyl reductase